MSEPCPSEYFNYRNDASIAGGPSTQTTGQFDPNYNLKQMACREKTAQEVLTDMIDALDRKLEQLRALRKALPLELPYHADAILRDLINQLRANRPDKY